MARIVARIGRHQRRLVSCEIPLHRGGRGPAQNRGRTSLAVRRLPRRRARIMDEPTAPVSPDPPLQSYGAEKSRIEPAPDHAEQSLADLVDDAVPRRSYEMLPMVGLGGSAGSIAALQGFISEPRRVDDALRESEALFRTIVTQAAAGVAHIDLHGRMTLVNARFALIAGCSFRGAHRHVGVRDRPSRRSGQADRRVPPPRRRRDGPSRWSCATCAATARSSG